MWIFKKYGSRMIVTAVTIILIIIIGITASGRENITVIENKIGKIITPVQKVFYNVGYHTVSTFKSIANITQLREENQKLKKEIASLKSKNRAYEDIISKSDILRNEAILKQNSKYNFVSAQIVGKDPGNWFDKFIIDKGAKDGIKKGSIVVQAVNTQEDIIIEGLVGRVVDVGDNWAKVISLIDKGSNVSFKVIRTQDGGIASGSTNGELGGYLFDAKADVVAGDKLITSGLGEVYVEGLYIGDISNVFVKNDDLIKRISIKPAVDFKKLYKVFVILGNKE